MVVPFIDAGAGFEAMSVVPDVTGAKKVVEGIVVDEDALVGAWVSGALLVLCCQRVSLVSKGSGVNEVLR